MKLSIITLFLSLSTLTTITTTASNDTILDIAGDNLRPGTKYNILPVFRGRGGGISLAHLNHSSSCPLAVVQELSEVNAGQPLTFYPVNGHDKTVKLSTDVNVEFTVTATVWKLSDVAEECGNRRYVVSGGVKGKPGLETVSNWFRIERSESGDYKLVFCPHVCDYCKVLCGDLGVFVDGGRRWLGFGGDFFPVMFRKFEHDQ
ncbi:kunitz trypsin inhibitor 5-like [Dioscorea cayenensis subsp. rotundata]|uniref:Kunitz trypsin inhibitor 5-like n=1 Tax=Dioscorea cayennensis subsp. rotundata TaxID=55577 RepID=A0AB40CG53_DIOCR|nr:kunitz trypsin inhibitor 5-like [Dioscorea cayenensis subsp. rotundata]